MATQVGINPLSRQKLVSALAAIRREWQDATEDSLIDVEASVGLLLADLVEALGLTSAERALALGEDLVLELGEVFAPHHAERIT